MNYGKALEEVWEWRAAFAKELEKVPENERVKYINDKAEKLCRQYGINCRKPAQKEPAHT
ncbi:MAG: hypothetical protein A2487_05345 [Candidatus Raymondbacteria bacterium RifOxyC12_full_50_8]|uniref:Uncharacterized protein n=1 Tax=Candidatus Raymondbacteria bacterium RIFOXYD12_FULL_49_13 TaxID=1817890 RepID=A0A1F7FAE9_UNCRA|nr:MAG: hypothetical protein A2248_00545 [Candidatus Raymondbacteria bacterium RIFOXYA2_FULL_49_16]OGJ97438.1 MAG: hypothetical protein A2453_10095 [Candidatus Raymondbacteria bacterium RIFOXYC2_FULL_50_21]OGK01757.1 MAG: hypothetical protein A2350_17545 [Candidatus Raymondbacteria bacterium RifOxyB12_full_50_8]OGK03591.1 MAG: hypothetical protein A2519_11800 [Candidatus Raymondbacteria bacterium RIFOXYD12_FULL_49_13]OGK07637.1 MAG: hypothetical protein A2487_05345 [Candidatus Raymondbacteria b